MNKEEIKKVLNRLELSESEKYYFNKEKENFNITEKLFRKDGSLYSIKILYKDNNIFFQLKKDRKIIKESKNNIIIKNKIIHILEN